MDRDFWNYLFTQNITIYYKSEEWLNEVLESLDDHEIIERFDDRIKLKYANITLHKIETPSLLSVMSRGKRADCIIMESNTLTHDVAYRVLFPHLVRKCRDIMTYDSEWGLRPALDGDYLLKMSIE